MVIRRLWPPARRTSGTTNGSRRPSSASRVRRSHASNSAATRVRTARYNVVTLNARMGQLNDGASYTSDITLNAQIKKLTATVQNTGYRKTN